MSDTTDGSFFSKKSFYGSSRPREVNVRARLTRKERELKRNVLLPQYQPRIDSPSDVWRVFHRQSEALSFVHSQRCQDIHVFAFESETFSSRNGQRLYLVCSYEHFWFYYSRLTVRQRHHYEVIPADSVCRLYLDLEFDRTQNPLTDGERLTNVYLQYICAWLKRLYHVDCSLDNILILDASTEVKFSQHAIFHVPNAAFRNNISAGNFVRHIYTELCRVLRPARTTSSTNAVDTNQNAVNKDPIDESKDSALTQVEDDPISTKIIVSVSDKAATVSDVKNLGQMTAEWLESIGLDRVDLESLFVKHRNGDDSFFADLGVYSRNRNFRLLHSTKLGKSSGELVVARTNQFGSRRPSTCRPTPSKRFKTSSVSPAKQRSADEQIFLDSLVCSVEFSDCTQLLDFDGVQSDKGVGHYSSHHGRDPSVDHHEGYESSPFPVLDKFVTSVVKCRGKEEGRIWRWAYFQSGGAMIVYDIVNNRWCANIGREHRSNNIIIVVDLRRGVYYQKCHDPVCRAAQFRSPDTELPADVWKEVESSMETTRPVEDSEPEVTDSELLNAVAVMEEMNSWSLEDVEKNFSSNNDAFDDDLTDEQLLSAAHCQTF